MASALEGVGTSGIDGMERAGWDGQEWGGRRGWMHAHKPERGRLGRKGWAGMGRTRTAGWHMCTSNVSPKAAISMVIWQRETICIHPGVETAASAHSGVRITVWSTRGSCLIDRVGQAIKQSSSYRLIYQPEAQMNIKPHRLLQPTSGGVHRTNRLDQVC